MSIIRIFGPLLGTALAYTSVVSVAQELTPFQRQVLGGIKKMLTEYVQKTHANCSSSKRVCDIERVDVLDEVLERWENTPDYGRYAVNVMDWQAKMAVAIRDMADDYVIRHSHLDAGFDKELNRRISADPAFRPPEEYLCRHMFGTLHLNGSQGPCK
jgi:hypothetical protein